VGVKEKTYQKGVYPEKEVTQRAGEDINDNGRREKSQTTQFGGKK